MAGLGPLEIILVVVLLFLVFKAKKIPEIVQAFGKGIIEFKRAVRDEPSELDAGDSEKKLHSDTRKKTADEAHSRGRKEG